MQSALSGPRPAVCLVTSEIAPVTPGGIGGVVRATLETLGSGSFDCHLLLDASRGETRAAKASLAQHLQVWSVDELAERVIPRHAFRSEAYWRSYRIWRALEALARRKPLDVVEFPDYAGAGYVAIKARRLGLNRSLDARLIVRIHGSGELAAEFDGNFCSSPPLLQQAQCERYAVENCDALISPSREVTSWLGKRYALSERVFEFAPPFARWGGGNEHCRPAGEGPLELLCVGKLQPLKGVRELLAAAIACLERLGPESLRVHLVGSDESRGRLREEVPKRLRRAFRFYGPLGPPEIRELANSCHAAVFASRMETFCLAAHELNWLGVPLLLSDIPAFRAYFEDGCDALLFGRADGELAALLEGLKECPERLDALRWNGATIRSQSATDYLAMLGELEPEGPGAGGAFRSGTSASSDPRVSVVVPYFEMDEYIDETLGSVEASDFADWEVVLVDDGSRSPEARAKFDLLRAEKVSDARYRFHRQRNGGLASARNSGIALARGEYVLPLDADDLIDRTFLSTAVTALDRNPDLGFVSCIARCFRSADARDVLQEWIVPYDPDPALLLFEHGCGTAACVFRRGALADHPYDEGFRAYEDWDLQVGLRRAGVRGEVIPAVLFYYRMRRDGLVRSRAHVEHDVLLAQMISKHFPTIPRELRQALEIYVHELSRLRGLGSGSLRPSVAGARAAFLEGLRSFYLRRLKSVLSRHLTDAQRNRLTNGVKRLVGAGLRRRDP